MLIFSQRLKFFWIINFWNSVSLISHGVGSPTNSGNYSGPEGWLLQKNGSHTILGLWNFSFILFSLYCFLDQWADSNRKNVENGGAHTPTASSAPSDLETFMRLLYLTTIVVNFQEPVFPQFSGTSIPFIFFFVVVARLTSGNHQPVPLLIQLSLSHTHYFIWSMCPYRKCADIRGTDQVKP